MSNFFYVGDDYRTNPLSNKNGGCTVIIEYTNGRVMAYDKVKNPRAYIRTAYENPKVKQAYIKR
jgi:hypothetical protein